ncbi:hypothetical protein SAMN05216436_14210 [bacterium A37T11]|nr:hypothetical protein SAMN05216436_14210 [bacterium A37T11]
MNKWIFLVFTSFLSFPLVAQQLHYATEEKVKAKLLT